MLCVLCVCRWRDSKWWRCWRCWCCVFTRKIEIGLCISNLMWLRLCIEVEEYTRVKRVRHSSVQPHARQMVAPFPCISSLSSEINASPYQKCRPAVYSLDWVEHFRVVSLWRCFWPFCSSIKQCETFVHCNWFGHLFVLPVLEHVLSTCSRKHRTLRLTFFTCATSMFHAIDGKDCSQNMALLCWKCLHNIMLVHHNFNIYTQWM